MSRLMKSSDVDWIGDIPTDWSTVRLKEITKKTITKGTTPSTIGFEVREQGAARFYKIENITNGTLSGSGGYISEQCHKAMLRSSLMNGDILFAIAGTIGSVAEVVADDLPGNINQALAIVRLKKNCTVSYVKNCLSIAAIHKRVECYGGVIQNFNLEDLKNLAIPLPPLPEQIAIADYLDKTTALIDKQRALLVRKKALLQEHKKALIHEAVTNGLNPGVPMKASGVDWIGEVSKSWEIGRCKDIFTLKKNEVVNGGKGYSLLSLTKQGVIVRDMENPSGKFPANFETYQEIDPGDFIFCLFDIEETPRTIGVSNFTGMITGAYTAMRLASGYCSKFMEFQMLSFDQNKALRPLYTGMRNTIPKSVFGGISIALPPLTEQIKIANYLENMTALIDKQLVLIDRKIDSLSQFRTSVIHEAVTKGVPSQVEVV